MLATLKLAGFWALGRLQNITDAVLATGASIAVMAVIIHGLVMTGLVFAREALIVVLNNSNLLIDHEICLDLWAITLNIANSIFLLALVVASIAIILRIDTGTYQIKKFITALVAAVALSNLSYLIMRALVGLGDSLAVALGSIGGGTAKKGWEYLIELSRVPAIPDKTDWYPAIMNLIFGALMLWILFKITIFVFERMLAIALLTILAPLAFASTLLPNLKEYSKNWWPMAIKWILAWPIFIGVIKIATLFLGHLGTPQTIISNLSGPLFGIEASTEGFSVPPQYLFGIIGLFILYYAAELPKKLNLSAPLSGMVGTGAEALAGKGLVGKAGGWVGATIRSTAPARAVEGWRKAQVGQGGTNRFGRFINRVVSKAYNPQAMRDIAVADTEKIVLEKTIDNVAHQAQEKSKVLAAQKAIVPKNPDGSLIKVGPKYDAYKATEKEHTALLGSLQYNNEQLNKKISLENIGSADSLTEKLHDAIKDGKAGKAVRTAYQLRTLARSVSRRPEDAAIARETLGSDSIKQGLDSMGLDSSRYSVRSSGQVTGGDYDESMDEASMRAENKRKELERDLGDALNIAKDSPELGLSFAMLSVLKSINNNLQNSTAFKNLSIDDKKKQLQTVIDAREDTGSTSNNDLIDHIDGERSVTKKLSNSEKSIYKEINKALSAASPNNDKQTIGKFGALFNINPAQMSNTILKLEGLQAAEQQENEIKTAIKEDNKRSEISYVNSIRNQIQATALKKVSQDNNITISASTMTPDIQNKLDTARKAEFDEINEQYEKMGADLDKSLEKFGSDFSNQTVDNATFNLDDYKAAIRDIPASLKFFPSESALDDATIGKLKTYQRQVKNALDKIQF